MNRIDLLKQLVQKRGQEKIQRSGLPLKSDGGPSEAQSNEPKMLSQSETDTTSTPTEPRGRPVSSSPSYVKSARSTTSFVDQIHKSLERDEGERMDIGKNNMKDESKMARYPDTMPSVASKGAIVISALPNVSEMRSEIWDVLQKMKNGQIDVRIAREFCMGCNTIAKFLRLEIDAHKLK